MSTALALLLACVVFASGLAIHDGIAARSCIEGLAALAIASLALSARAIDVNFVGRVARGIKIAAAIPAAWMIVQLSPIPVGAQSIWPYANEALGVSSWGHISVDLGRTVLALTFYLANVALIVVGVFVAKDRRRAELILFALTAIAAITVVGLLVGKWGLITGANNPDDILSGISALGILASLANMTHAIERYESEVSKPTGSALNIRMVLSIIGIGLAVDVIGLSAGATLNVGLTAMFGIAAFGSVQIIRRVELGGWAALMLVGTIMIALMMIIFWRYDPGSSLSPLLQFASRPPADVLSISQRMLSDSKWLGTGAGTFAVLVPIYQDLGSSIAQPPSTIAGFAIELGLPMCLFTIALAVWITVILYRSALDRGRDSFYPAAASAGVVIMLGEAFCDASLLNASVAILGDALIGLGLAQSISGRE